MITLIGMGSGTPGSLTAQGLAALQGADRILGAKRLLAALPEGCTGNRQALYKPDEILACLAAHPDEEIALVYSGDTGFYSGASCCPCCGPLASPAGCCPAFPAYSCWPPP